MFTVFMDNWFMKMLQDIRAYDKAKEAVAAGEELIPSELILFT